MGKMTSYSIGYRYRVNRSRGELSFGYVIGGRYVILCCVLVLVGTPLLSKNYGILLYITLKEADMKHIVSFSGGKDSTAMLLRMLETGMEVDYIIHIDTSKEYPEMYQHIEKVKEEIKPRKIITAVMDFDYWFAERIKQRGKRKGDIGYGWPNHFNRWCTAWKRDEIKRQIRALGILLEEVIEYHGIAADESERIKKDKRQIRYPLVEWNWTESDALKYCYDRGFDWGGLYEIMPRVSCYLCPLSRIGQLRYVYTERPELWETMQMLDKKSRRSFRSDYTLEELEAKFKK
jgi:3'-phosphoadenosine 5'-phosphosulfate sulfotransferase (PAPS reductase)/FAD synthetase